MLILNPSPIITTIATVKLRHDIGWVYHVYGIKLPEAVPRDTLESIQRRAGLWIANAHGPNVNVTELLKDLSQEPLDVRRWVSRLTFLYKVLN